jgi:hypothetical protein
VVASNGFGLLVRVDIMHVLILGEVVGLIFNCTGNVFRYDPCRFTERLVSICAMVKQCVSFFVSILEFSRIFWFAGSMVSVHLLALQRHIDLVIFHLSPCSATSFPASLNCSHNLISSSYTALALSISYPIANAIRMRLVDAGRVGAFTPPGDWEGDGGALPFPLGARVVQVSYPGQQREAEPKSLPTAETWVQEAGGRAAGSHLQLQSRALVGASQSQAAADRRETAAYIIGVLLISVAWFMLRMQETQG